jgi:hypothetical protein
MIGHYPKEAPALLSAEVVKTTTPGDGSTRKRVVLMFDTPNKKSFEIEVWEPKPAGGAARPLLLTQPRHYQRQKWGEEALRRGYVVCLYPGLDVHHKERGYPGYQNVWKTFKNEYPDATWDSSLGTQAWLAGRTLDYLPDPKHGYRVDKRAVGITGFSRYGKQSIYAAAFDERFTCVVARSAGTPAMCPVRFGGRQAWKAKQRKSALTMPRQASVRQKIEWMLGEKPASLKDAGQYHIKTGQETGDSGDSP